MKQYIGTKIINAEPMDRLAYNVLRGWKQPQDEDLNEKGYLVEYVNGGKPCHPDFDYYISWSPKDIFEEAYKQSGEMSFGDAITYMKLGYKVARNGWNGKGMFIFYVPANAYPENGTMVGYFENDLVPYGEYIAMKTAQDNVVPWLASQTNMLSEDWKVL